MKKIIILIFSLLLSSILASAQTKTQLYYNDQEAYNKMLEVKKQARNAGVAFDYKAWVKAYYEKGEDDPFAEHIRSAKDLKLEANLDMYGTPLSAGDELIKFTNIILPISCTKGAVC
jgi:uncharacterized protein YxeA